MAIIAYEWSVGEVVTAANMNKIRTDILTLSSSGGGLSISTETLSATKTLIDDDDSVQLLNPDGTDRQVNLPAEASTNPVFFITNIGTAGADLKLYDDGGTHIMTINNGQMARCFPNLSSAWYISKEYSVTLMPTGAYGFIVAGGGGSAVQDDVYRYSPDTWTTMGLYTTSMHGCDGCEVDAKGYVVYGTTTWASSGGATQATNEYSPDTWTAKTNGPADARYKVAVAPIGEVLYCCGGEKSGGVDLQDMDEYDPDTWTSMTNYPSYLVAEGVAVEVDSKFHFLGGLTGSTTRAYLHEFVASTWAQKTSCSPGRYGAGFTSPDNVKAYAFYGYSSAHLLDTDEYDPDTWTAKTNAPATARRNVMGLAIEAKVYSVGGYTGSFFDDTDEYDPDTWTSKTTITAARMQSGKFTV